MSPNEPIRVVLVPHGREKDQRSANRYTTYSAVYGVLSHSPTTSPAYAACRALVALGLPDAPIEFVHEAALDLVVLRHVSFHAASQFTISEGVATSPRVARFREVGDAFAETHQDA